MLANLRLCRRPQAARRRRERAAPGARRPPRAAPNHRLCGRRRAAESSSPSLSDGASRGSPVQLEAAASTGEASYDWRNLDIAPSCAGRSPYRGAAQGAAARQRASASGGNHIVIIGAMYTRRRSGSCDRLRHDRLDQEPLIKLLRAMRVASSPAAAATSPPRPPRAVALASTGAVSSYVN